MTGIFETPDGEVSEVAEADVAAAASPRPVPGGGPGRPVEAEVVEAEVVDGDDDAVDAEVVDGGPGDPLATVTAERDEYLDALRRLQAEFENYRKRMRQQETEQRARAAQSLVEQLLPVLDALDLAAEHQSDPDSPDAKALVAASSLLTGVLAKEGLERLDPTGDAFDPTAHEAVGHLPWEDGDEGDVPGPVVAQVMRPGYRWKGTVVRPAMVTVRG